MELDWTQIAMVASAFGASFGASVGIPLANMWRRPGIQKAIEKGVAENSLPLVAKDMDQARDITDLKQQLAFALQRIAFLERLVAREPEPIALGQPKAEGPAP